MPTETLPAVTSGSLGWRSDLRTVRVFRLALTVTVAMAVAQGFNWPLSFVYVAVVSALLGLPIPEPTLRETFNGLANAVVVFILLGLRCCSYSRIPLLSCWPIPWRYSPWATRCTEAPPSSSSCSFSFR